jgi:hypothetical protein
LSNYEIKPVEIDAFVLEIFGRRSMQLSARVFRMSALHELAMLMYADRLSTYALLEGGAFLPIGANSANVHRDDLRLASCLRRLRSMTSWVSPYTDIDKRCREAIVAHVELRPSLRGFYGSACTN